MIVKAGAFLTRDGLSITRLSGRPRTPGNVGVALSGGGSRSASASMGALRALQHFGLLEHVRAISCVSGGSWFAVPFSFLPAHFDELAFLGPHVADPGSLQFARGEAPNNLRTLPRGNYGHVLTSFDASVASIVASAMANKHRGVDGSRLWTREIGQRLLAPFGLARFDATHPSDSFAADSAMASSMAMRAPELPAPYLLRERQHSPRPALIVGGAMRVQGREGNDVLAPVQFTPWFSGAMGSDAGKLGGKDVGGGGISSYAFGGQWLSGDHDKMQIELRSALALSDITGISSAAYADMLNDRGLIDLSPRMSYFSPFWSRPAGVTAVFADGGSLENTGVANLLAYTDIDAVVAIVSPPKHLDTQARDVVVEQQIPALFGYQAYERGVGYRRFGEPGAGNPDLARNQVFSDTHGEFQQLLDAFGECLHTGAANVVVQELETVDNPVFAVRGGRKVRVLWAYLSNAKQWRSQLDLGVRASLDPSFPTIATMRTALPLPTVSLLAHFSGWQLAQHRLELTRMFFPGAS